MGKNPNANRDKKKKFTQNGSGDDKKLEELQMEAARKGVEIWQLQDENKEDDSESSEEDTPLDVIKEEQIDSSSKK